MNHTNDVVMADKLSLSARLKTIQFWQNDALLAWGEQNKDNRIIFCNGYRR